MLCRLRRVLGVTIDHITPPVAEVHAVEVRRITIIRQCGRAHITFPYGGLREDVLLKEFSAFRRADSCYRRLALGSPSRLDSDRVRP